MRQNTFKKIVLRHKDTVYSHAYYFSGNREDAEDITQDAFIKLWNNRHKVARSLTKAWLLKVTRNLCIDYQRKRRELSISTSSYEDAVYDTEASPEQKIIEKDALGNVLEIINKLPEKLRSILIMRDIQDLKYQDIADAMDMPLSSVKVSLHRGRKILVKNLKSLKNELMIGV